MSDLLKRLERLEGAFEDHAEVLLLKDGTKVFLPQAAFLDVSLAFMNLMHEGELSWDGKPIPHEWIVAYANSIPEPDEGTCMTGTRELCRRYLAGEKL